LLTICWKGNAPGRRHEFAARHIAARAVGVHLNGGDIGPDCGFRGMKIIIPNG
jgi:hypothetical protein